jgi:Cdc6-like AAA superfamily ATPase
MLEHRVDRAVVNEACDTSAIAKAAALAAQKVENARQVLDLLRVGAELAEQHGETPVTDDHIETARERVQRGRVAKVIRGQTEYV